MERAPHFAVNQTVRDTVMVSFSAMLERKMAAVVFLVIGLFSVGTIACKQNREKCDYGLIEASPYIILTAYLNRAVLRG